MVVWKRGEVDCVRDMGKEALLKKVVDVTGVSDRVMAVVVFEENVLGLICGYVLQGGRSLE